MICEEQQRCSPERVTASFVDTTLVKVLDARIGYGLVNGSSLRLKGNDKLVDVR